MVSCICDFQLGSQLVMTPRNFSLTKKILSISTDMYIFSSFSINITFKLCFYCPFWHNLNKRCGSESAGVHDRPPLQSFIYLVRVVNNLQAGADHLHQVQQEQRNGIDLQWGDMRVQEGISASDTVSKRKRKRKRPSFVLRLLASNWSRQLFSISYTE